MEERFEKLNDLLVNYSRGNFDFEIEVSDNLDDIDTIISGIGMLGEELKSVTISKNFFNNIFNAVTDMLFVLDENGIIQNHNQSVLQKTGLEQHQILNSDISQWLEIKQKTISDIIHFVKLNGFYEAEKIMFGFQGKKIPVLISVTNLYPEKEEQQQFLLNARDLTKIKEYESEILASQEKYKRIFDDSGDTIFLAKSNGQLVEINAAGMALFGLREDEISEVSISDFFISVEDKRIFFELLKSNRSFQNLSIRMMDHEERILETTISANIIPGGGIQGIIRNITKEKETEKLLLKTIVDTQEKERQRFAKDLHDSLGQQLSAITFYINTIRQQTNPDPAQILQVLGKSNDGLNAVISELRNICFNLMPRTLENRGLYFAVVELCKKVEFDKMLKFDLRIDEHLPSLEKNLEITIYRIIQEFINNSLKHGKAQNILVEGYYNKKGRILTFRLQDDGIGFEIDKAKSGGMGLTNIKTRLQPYDGEFRYNSEVGVGTVYEFDIPFFN
ncbi:MAG: PAS domain S-box protein [Cytophagaceae bacterium]|nr:PAS domain S-box protein [Cytophagaceae bacterium]